MLFDEIAKMERSIVNSYLDKSEGVRREWYIN